MQGTTYTTPTTGQVATQGSTAASGTSGQGAGKANLMDVSRQWSQRPDDQRFTSLAALRVSIAHRQELTSEVVREVAGMQVQPGSEAMVDAASGGTLYLRAKSPDTGEFGGRAQFTYASFGQLAGIAGAPAGYLRRLSAPLVALNLNEDLARRGALAFSESGMSKMLVTQENGSPAQVRAFTSSTYGRVWDLDVVDGVAAALNDLDRDGSWGIPGTFGGNSGRQYEPYDGTGRQTTLYASGSDVFVFLADESRLLSQPGSGDYGTGQVGAGSRLGAAYSQDGSIIDLRHGASGRPMSRGFIVSNSETGARTLSVKFFTFDYVCCNRIVWGSDVLGGVTIRHTSGAPRRFMAEVIPAIRAFVEGSDAPMLARIAAAQAAPVGAGDGKGSPETLTAWLRSMGLSGGVAQGATAAAQLEEGRTDTVWAAIQGITAYARGVTWQDERVELETFAGGLMADKVLASAGRFERSTRGQRMEAGAGAGAGAGANR